MFKKLKTLYKIGSIVRKIYKWKLVLGGGLLFFWEVLAAVPEIVVMVAGVVLVALGMKNND